MSCVLIDIYCWCHNLCYFTVYLYCFLTRYCFYHSLVNKDFQYCHKYHFDWWWAYTVLEWVLVAEGDGGKRHPTEEVDFDAHAHRERQVECDATVGVVDENKWCKVGLLIEIKNKQVLYRRSRWKNREQTWRSRTRWFCTESTKPSTVFFIILVSK